MGGGIEEFVVCTVWVWDGLAEKLTFEYRCQWGGIGISGGRAFQAEGEQVP